MSHRELLEAELHRFEIDLTGPQKQALTTYCDAVAQWNKRINLTALSGAALIQRLVVEPVWIARELGLSGTLADIGSGNGSPAIPFEVVSGFQACHLVEARSKRAIFLRHLSALLKLPKLTVHRGRFEEMVSSIGTVDWVSLQAVALNEQLLDSIRLIAHTTTTIVWITSGPKAGAYAKSYKVVRVPLTGTQVFLFHLDLP